MQHNKFHKYFFIALFIVFSIDLALIVVTHHNWNTPMKKYLPIQKEMLKLRNSITDATFWVREASVDSKMNSQKKAMQYMYAYDFDTFITTHGIKQDASLFSIFIKIEHLLNKLREKSLADNLYKTDETSRTVFYNDYRRVLTLIDLTILHIDKTLQFELKKKEAFFANILTLFFTINIVIFGMLYLAKKRMDRLSEALEEEQMISEASLQHAAEHDNLTHLPNRVLLYDRLQQMIKQSQRSSSEFALLFFDVDHFKKVNDTLGHHVGDRILKIIADRLENNVRDIDTVARIGGDEFCVLVDDIRNTNMVIDIIQKLVQIIHDPISIKNQTIYPTVSIGITIYPDDGEQADVLLSNAGIAMFKAKEHGRNTYQFYTEEMSSQAFERLQIESGLRKAIDQEQLRVYFQPKVNALNDELSGMEALARWEHPEEGLMSPGRFIPVAEQSGLIYSLDLWIMKHTMLQVVEWHNKGFEFGKVSINLSMQYFKNSEFITTFKTLLEETKCPPSLLELEITESQIMEDQERGIILLNQLKQLHISISIDDFGTGYSSLSYLKKLPVDKLKIDQSFVSGLPDDNDDVAIISSIVALARSMQLDTIAEGVETLEQKEMLVELGCTNIQGYYYGKPMPAKALEEQFFTI